MDRTVQLRVLHNSPGQTDASAAGREGPGATDLAAREPETIVAWALEQHPQRLVVTTGFGMEGCVLIDMLARHAQAAGTCIPPVHYLDTHFLFPETHALRERLRDRYPAIEFINSGTALTPDAQAREHGAELWKTSPDRCCSLRKIEPMRRLLAGASAWMTALRRSQSEARAAIKVVDRDPVFGVTKINPLAAWSREQVWEYVLRNGVPYNELHERGYPSIGCTHCTHAVPGASVTDYSRAGRWAGTAKTECGLHWNEAGSGI
jgi:phosphoadenosine phosphosulfate reductase